MDGDIDVAIFLFTSKRCGGMFSGNKRTPCQPMIIFGHHPVIETAFDKAFDQ